MGSNNVMEKFVNNDGDSFDSSKGILVKRDLMSKLTMMTSSLLILRLNNSLTKLERSLIINEPKERGRNKDTKYLAKL